MRLFALLAASALAASALVLSACDVSTATPTPTDALSGALMPTSVQTSLTISATDAQGHQESRTFAATTALVNGHLPANPYAQNKVAFASAVNASTALNAGQKASLVAGADDAFDKLEADLNAAFDGVPRQMSLTLGNRVGDLASASFRFRPKTGAAFTLDGLYNVATTEFALVGIGFARGDGNAQGALVGLSGCAFQGALNRTSATHGCSATGLLAVPNAGVIGVGVNLTLGLAFARD